MLESSFSEKSTFINACIRPGLLKLAYCLYYVRDSKPKLTYLCNHLPSRQRHCLQPRYKKQRTNAHCSRIYFICKLMQQHSVTIGRAVECKPPHCQIKSCKPVCKELGEDSARWDVLNSYLEPPPNYYHYLWVRQYLIGISPAFCLCVFTHT